jgi:hypothetical protein
MTGVKTSQRLDNLSVSILTTSLTALLRDASAFDGFATDSAAVERRTTRTGNNMVMGDGFLILGSVE